jgi:hypothetical protein
VRKAGGNGTDIGRGIALDAASNVIVTGSSDSIPFSVGSTSFNASGTKAAFLKFDSNGTLLWARISLPQALFPPPDGVGITAGADAAGDLYFAGQFTGPINFGGTATVFPPPTGGIAFTNSAETDVFLLKYTSAGSIVWARQIGGANLQEVKSMAVTPAGDIFLAGRFNGTTSFANTNLTSGNTSWDTDAFLGKWDTAGNLTWVRQIGSNDTDHGLAVAVDAAGAPHLVASFKGTSLTVGGTTFDNPNLTHDLAAVKFSSAGLPIWAMQIERPLTLPEEGGPAAAIDRDGNLLITGAADNGAIFKSMPFPAGIGALFVTLIENGDPVWVKRAGAPGNYAGDYGTGIGVDGAGDIYLAGTLGPNDPGASALFDTFIPSYLGRRDIFVARIGDGAPPSTPNLSFALAGGNLVITWPLADSDFNLESVARLGDIFAPAAEPRTTNGATISVTISTGAGQRFYRLVRP